MWSSESNWKRREVPCRPFLKNPILLLYKCRLETQFYSNGYQYVSFSKLNPPRCCNSFPSSLAHKLVYVTFPTEESWPEGWQAHLTHPSLCQVLIGKQASIDTRDFLFRTKWTSILVEKKDKAWVVYFTFRAIQWGSHRARAKLSCWTNGKRCPFQHEMI